MDVLVRVFRDDSYADVLLDAKFRDHAIPKADRSLAMEIVHGTLRNLGYLDWILTRFYRGAWRRLPDAVRFNLETALYQILFLDRVPAYAAVDEAVRMARQDGGDRPAGLVNGILRNILRQDVMPEPPAIGEDPVRFITIRHSHPEWLVRRWVEAFGAERTVRICEAGNTRPGFGIRVNPIRTARETVRETLESDGFDVRVSPLLQEMLVLGKAGDIVRSASFREGLISIQDVSAALAARLVAPEPGEIILDMTAAPGGKSFHMAELTGDRARILAMDIHPHRVRKLRETAGRLGLKAVHPVCGDGRRPPLLFADRVLVDAPCSGIGVIGRRPEIRWRLRESEIGPLIRIQEELLESAAERVRPGGVLVYSTCTVLHEENRIQIGRFCGRHPEFTKEDAAGFVDTSVVTDGFVETWPDVHGMDGSFAVRLRKRESNHESQP